MRDRISKFRPSPTAAMIVAVIALLLPIDAFSIANSVGHRVSNLITGGEIRDGSVGYADLSRKAKRRLRGQRGPRGRRGSRGRRGPRGRAGEPARLTGIAAGGDLTGSYPDPLIRPGAITADKLSAAGTAAGQILRSDGTSASWVDPPFQPLFRRTFVVSASGSAAANGAALRRALDDAAATASDPALLRLEPGVYDVGENGLAMKQFVDIEGSGEGVTTITGPGRGSGLGTIAGADDAELRFLTVATSGGSDSAVAIRNDGSSPRVTHVTVVATGSASTLMGIMNTGSAAPVVRDTTVRVTPDVGGSGIGIHNDSAPARIERADIAVSGGLVDVGIDNVTASPVRIRYSVVSATASGGEPSTALRSSRSLVFVDGSHLSGDNAAEGSSNNQYRIGASLVEGTVTVSPSSADTRCVFSYRADYTPLGSDCG